MVKKSKAKLTKAQLGGVLIAWGLVSLVLFASGLTDSNEAVRSSSELPYTTAGAFLAAGLGNFKISTGQGGCQSDRLNGLTVRSLTIIPRQGDRQGRSKVDGRPRNRILAGRSARVFGCSVEALRSRPEDQSGNA